MNKNGKYDIFQRGLRKGQPKTLSDRVVRFLVGHYGCKEVDSRSKRRQFTMPATDKYYFVGKNGSCRVGKVASRSFSATASVRKHMESWESEIYTQK